jgi:photosystem II stability/assembly factor-like uncharacterized protein
MSAKKKSNTESQTSGQTRRSSKKSVEANSKAIVASVKKSGKRVATPITKLKTKETIEREEGPRGWLFPIMEAAYTKLTPRAQAEESAVAEASAFTEDAAAVSATENAFRSALQPGRGQSVLAAVSQDLWVDRLAEYKRRKVASVQARAALPAAFAPPGPVVPGERNWAPLGPSVVMNGQAQGFPPVAGRIAGIAIAPGGQIIYAASANGGVFRSNDGGISWRSLMDAFDVDPTNFASTSLACGAIALDQADPNRVYVGTGEGDTFAIFQNRITNALPAYRGIGPIRSDDGGATWLREPTENGSPSLAGKAFFALAVDPANRENVVGATTEGLYQRVIQSNGQAEWVRRRSGVHSGVVVAFDGSSKGFFAAEWGRGVFYSTDGATWPVLGSGFPTTNVGRIALGVQPNNPNLVYAFVANTRGALLGVYRLDGVSGTWKEISNPPDVLPTSNGGSQGDYDLAIAVDPVDANLIYLGGSYANVGPYPASIWRCRVQVSGTGYRMDGVSIGVNAHADVHVLTHTPGNQNALWTGCDGGVFLNRDPRGTGIFAARNNGLACLCPNFFAQHPTDPNIMFCGLQDNGTARTSGGPIWQHVNWGDGGYCLINWNNPNQVLVFANGRVYRATDGGQGHNSWTQYDFSWAMMTEPIVGPPYNPAQPADAKLVALGAGRTVFLSRDFGNTWTGQVDIPAVNGSGIYAMAFASATRFFVGTTAGEVFRVARVGNMWQVTRIDDVAAGQLELNGIISDIAVDWSDATLASCYVAFGGTGDYVL